MPHHTAGIDAAKSPARIPAREIGLATISLIAKRLGHAHEHVTAIYAHVSVAAQIEAAERAELMIPAALSTQSPSASTQAAHQAAQNYNQNAVSAS